MRKTILFVSLVLALSVAQSQEKAVFRSDKLMKVWESPNTLMIPESVCYDPSGHQLFVSNINGKPTEKDGNGFITRLSADDGSILELRWVSGLDAPKGMGIYDGVLYVTDIDRVAAIDIKTKSIVKFYEFPEAGFLNDIAIDRYGAVYISDMMSTRVYRINGGKTEIWLDDPVLTDPNGLYAEKDCLVIGCKKIVKAGFNDKKLTVIADNTGDIDGLEGLGDGHYIYSDWQGNVYLITKDKQIEKILDTTPAGMNAADIEFVPFTQMLYVPTFLDNRVVAYRLR